MSQIRLMELEAANTANYFGESLLKTVVELSDALFSIGVSDAHKEAITINALKIELDEMTKAYNDLNDRI